MYRARAVSSSSYTGAHRQISENENAASASGVMRRVQANLRDKSNTAKISSNGQTSIIWYNFPRRMIGVDSLKKRPQNQGDFKFKYSRPQGERIFAIPPLRDFIEAQYLKYTVQT